MSHAVRRALPGVALALALLTGVGVAALGEQRFISPRFSFGLPNTTSNWSSTVPVTWALLDRDNTKRVVGALPGYSLVWVTDDFIEILAGERGGLFHVRALRNSCADDASGPGCVATAVWLVLSDAQMAGMLLTCCAALALCAVGVVRRLQPAPESAEEKAQRMTGMAVVHEYYGSFEAAHGRGGGRGGSPRGEGVRLETRRFGPPRRLDAAGDTL